MAHLSVSASRNPTYEPDIRRRLAASPVRAFFGFETDAVRPGDITLSLAARPELGHLPGFFQGGILAAMADYAGSYAAYTLIPDDWDRLTVDFTIKFLAAAKGDRLLGRGRVLSPGRTLSHCAADLSVLRDGREHLCATALVTVRHIAPRPLAAFNPSEPS